MCQDSCYLEQEKKHQRFKASFIIRSCKKIYAYAVSSLRVRYIEHQGQKLNCVFLSLQLCHMYREWRSIMHDGDNLTQQMLVSLFHSLSYNIEHCITRCQKPTQKTICTSIVCINHACSRTSSCSNYSISLLTRRIIQISMRENINFRSLSLSLCREWRSGWS